MQSIDIDIAMEGYTGLVPYFHGLVYSLKRRRSGFSRLGVQEKYAMPKRRFRAVGWTESQQPLPTPHPKGTGLLQSNRGRGYKRGSSSLGRSSKVCTRNRLTPAKRSEEPPIAAVSLHSWSSQILQAHSQAPFCHGRVLVTRQFISCKRLQWTPRSLVPSFSSIAGGRIGEAKIVTKKTKVVVKINLGGRAVSETNTGIPFLDHMLDQLASHGSFDVHVKAVGDIISDDYYRTEDVGVAMGTALLQAVGDRKEISLYGDFSAPHDEALVQVSLGLSGRPHLSYGLSIPTERVGTYDTQLVEHFFQSLVNTSGMTLHIRQLAGRNSHHIIEATFKAFARALRQATEHDPRHGVSVPSQTNHHIQYDDLCLDIRLRVTSGERSNTLASYLSIMEIVIYSYKVSNPDPESEFISRRSPPLSCALMGLPVSPCSFTDSGSANSRMSNSVIPPGDPVSARALGERIGEEERGNVSVKINLDGRAVAENNTSIDFLDLSLNLLASHGSFDVHVKATGDSHRDDYHTTEDVAMAMGVALKQALGDRIGINQLGCFSTVLDDALVLVSLVDRSSVVVSGGVNVVFPFMRNIGILQYFLIQFLLKDLSGRPHLSYDLQIPRETVGTYDPQLVEHFFISLVDTFGMTLHIRQFAGRNSNHILEATFKAFARALRQATEYDARRHDSVPSIAFSVAAWKVSTDFLDTALTVLKVGYLSDGVL
ncbi:UNVERIFIED_CONTAM: Imidazoleglycerol-phosphate dehydratase, chloroplastic [Sesamum calycinum]|uniref:imidazoleglycerol-phosphate dehydratase n=1 Tax=Sesamum calycinum TaxID=2727403 RepID=A0AAW2QJS9_9LAMI